MAHVTQGNAEVDIQAQLSQLNTDHQVLEGQLNILDALIYLTPDEQVERKNIQKEKLMLKDRIATLVEGSA
jgi:hypothetical protein